MRYEVIRTGPVWRVLDRWVVAGSAPICVFTGSEAECAGWVSANARAGSADE